VSEYVISTNIILDKPHPKSGRIYLSEDIQLLLSNELFRYRLYHDRIFGAFGENWGAGAVIPFSKVTHVVRDIFVADNNTLSCKIKPLSTRAGKELRELLIKIEDEEVDYLAKFIIIGTQHEKDIVRVTDIRYVHLQEAEDEL
jgi:hypothetical protein